MTEVYGPATPEARPATPASHARGLLASARRHPDLTILTGVVLLSLAVRLPALATVPPNITADEADNLQYILLALEGKGSGLFGFDWKPAPAFSIYLMLWFMRVFGMTAEGLRMASVVLSSATLVPCYFLARRHTGRIAAAATIVLLSTGLWYLHFSRSGWENVHVAFYGTMAAWLLTLALERRQYRYYAGAGCFAALGLYGYFSGRLIVAGLLAFMPFALWQHRDQVRRLLLGFAIMVVVCAALFGPELSPILKNWERFNQRTRVVSLLNAPRPYLGQTTTTGILLSQIERTFGTFVLMDGTLPGNGRYFPPQRPPFDLLTGLLYVAGLVIGAWRWRQTALWWCMFVVPLLATQVFATGTPDLARAVGVVPFMYLFVALALDALLKRRGAALGAVQLVVLAAVPLAAYANVGAYFEWLAQPQAAVVREPAITVAQFPTWLETQTAEIRAGRRGLNVQEWQQRYGQSAQVAALPPPATAKPVVPTQQDPPPLAASFLASFGGEGSGDGALGKPRGVAIAPSGELFVADAGNRRVPRYDKNGKFLGDLPAQFEEPSAVAVAPGGKVYVLDALRDAIAKFDPNGGLVGWIGAERGMYRPRGISVDQAGTLYVADTGHGRVLVLDDEGRLIRALGEGSKLFPQPSDVITDRDGTLYVADPTRGRIVKLDAEGNYLLEWRISEANTQESPHFALAPGGALLISDPPRQRVISFTPDGQSVGMWSGAGDEAKLRMPIGIAADKEGNVYVVDAAAPAVKKFALGN